MSLTIADLAERTAIRTRKLRYVVDHQLVPGFELVKAGTGNARHMSEVQAFALVIAANLLEYGYTRTAVRTLMEALGGTKNSRKIISLPQIYANAVPTLIIGNLDGVQIKGVWYTLPGLRKAGKKYKPDVETHVNLQRIREQVARM